MMAHNHEENMAGFDHSPFRSGKIAHEVYRIGNGPSILLLHELPGLMPEDITLARRLSVSYTVYLPLLFGKPGDGHAILRDSILRVFLRTPCWGCEFNCASSSDIGGIVPWIAALALHVDDQNNHRGFGVIGNCLTGSVPMALMADDTVRPKLRCAVLSQPAVPLGFWPFPKPLGASGKIAVGLTPDQLRQAAASGVPTLAFRFVDDPVVPKERLDALTAIFPKDRGKFEFCPVNPDLSCQHWTGGPPSHHHAVLTAGNCTDAGSNGARAYQKLLDFLAAHMSG
jgi:dienelactone hydrolase